MVALLLTMVMGTAVALLLSAANVFMRDIGSAVNILTNLVRFGVPMIYPFTMVRGAVRCGGRVLPAGTRSPTRCC